MAKAANFGEKDWEDESASGSGKSDFFNMKDDGQYKIRIAGKPHEFAAHWVDAGATRKKVNCAGKDCILCAKGQKASIRYLIPAIFRSGPGVTPETISVTEFGPQVYGAIRNLFKTEDWGNPTRYDVIVDKNKARGASGTYFVTPASKFPLTDQEKADVAEFLQNMNLKEFSAPLSNELILEKLGPDVARAMGLTAPAASAAKPETEFNFEEGGDEYNFNN